MKIRMGKKVDWRLLKFLKELLLKQFKRKVATICSRDLVKDERKKERSYGSC